MSMGPLGFYGAKPGFPEPGKFGFTLSLIQQAYQPRASIHLHPLSIRRQSYRIWLPLFNPLSGNGWPWSAAAQAAMFYKEMSQNAIYQLVSYLSEVQMFFLLLFFGGLFGLLRRAEEGNGSLAATVFAAGVILALITPLAIMIEDHHEICG